MNLASKKYYLYIAISLSIVIHFSILLLGGKILIQQAQYNIQQSHNATEVDLVSSLPTPIEAPPKIEAPVEKKEEPKPEVAKPIPKTPAKKPTPRIQSKAQPTKSSTQISKQPQSRTSGKKPSAPRTQGARISARPDYLRNPPPRYPDFARRAHQQGTVILRVLVNEAGDPLSVIVRSSSGYQSLDNAALAAVRNWKFKPGTVAGVPIRSTVDVPVRFQLQN